METSTVKVNREYTKIENDVIRYRMIWSYFKENKDRMDVNEDYLQKIAYAQFKLSLSPQKFYSITDTIKQPKIKN